MITNPNEPFSNTLSTPETSASTTRTSKRSKSVNKAAHPTQIACRCQIVTAVDVSDPANDESAESISLHIGSPRLAILKMQAMRL